MPNFVAIGQDMRYGDFSIFRDGGRRHLGFLKFRNFNGREGKTASLCQILWRFVKLLRRYGDFSIFPRWRLSAILNL